MRLLIVTQKIDRNDSYFGFFPEWIDRFAKECESVTVIALERRAYDFPQNVSVLTLGKESRPSRTRYLFLLVKYAWQERNGYDAVFCHMSPLYVIAGSLVWKFCNKPIALWYVHRQVDLKLRFATRLADVIMTATPESFRLATPKARYLGQGVDVEALAPKHERAQAADGTLRVLVVGRITPIKRLEYVLQAARSLIDRGIRVRVTLIGEPLMPTDHDYAATLRALAAKLDLNDVLEWRGSVPFTGIAEAYHEHDVSVNIAPTGGLDKVVLESFAAGTPAFVTNQAFTELLGEYAARFLIAEPIAEDLASKLEAWKMSEGSEEVIRALRTRVTERYALEQLIHGIVKEFDSLLPGTSLPPSP